MMTWKMLALPLHNCVGDVILSNHQEYNELGRSGTHVSIFLMVVFDALLGMREGFLRNYFDRLTQSNDIVSLQETHGKMSSSKLLKYLPLDSRCMALSSRTMWMQVDQLSVFMTISFLKEQLVHMWLRARAVTTS